MIGFISSFGQLLFTITTAGNMVSVIRDTNRAIMTDDSKERNENIKNAIVDICGVIVSSAAVYAFSKLKE